MTFIPDKLTGNTIKTLTNKYMDKYGILWIQIIESSFLEGFQQPFFLEKISTHGKKREREL